MPQTPLAASASVVGVVVTYQSENDCSQLLAELTKQCDNVIVLDNGSDPSIASRIKASCETTGAQFIGLPENIGIAAAQNWGIGEARLLGATHVLLSDDDSLPPDNMVADLRRVFDRKPGTAAVGPLPQEDRPGGDQLAYVDRGWSPKRATARELEADLVEVAFLIASGCLISIEALDAIGGMNAAMFIDHVDLEWGLRARAAGFALYCAPRVVLRHALGDESVQLPGRDQPVHIHGPIRNYYILRNTVGLIRRNIMPWRWRIRYTYWALKYMAFNGILVDRLPERRKMLRRGLRDGLTGRGGRYEPR
ncbi:MAG: glycosyltransferase family 2 protein [Ancrocorticia sp.]|uniref:glycosyltransferase family 2 protein n=1 Tax=Ancrocorticia sp. TaxID=2593684 RepID=UPI003F8E9A97